MRFIWWIIYLTKFDCLVLIGVLLCSLAGALLKKPFYLLYIFIMTVMIAVGIYIGFSTFYNLDFQHPVLSVVVAIILNLIMDIGYLFIFSGAEHEDIKEEEISADRND